ncbi:MAG: sigma factor-like helix-turn-helix DNA-binding protein [Candidatus Staskawiczbacteria bacterium]|jgi:hypothetical protein
MEKVNYSKIYTSITKDLPDKTREILARRFGIGNTSEETLESIGKSMDITRERVRQIQDAGFTYIKNNKKEALDKIFKDFAEYLKANGGFKKEDSILNDFGGDNSKPYVLFALTLGEQFNRVCEKKDFYSFWTTMPDGEQAVRKNLGMLVSDIKKSNNPLVKREFLTQFASKHNFDQNTLLSYLEVSKNIRESNDGKIGLVEWPEINPRGVRDKSFLVFKKENKPLHFTAVASLIDTFNYNLPNKKTLPQTVHNELIKDSRFVLVGRGTYALKEWGYDAGTVKDVLVKIMKENSQPMDRENLVKKVLAQRFVAKNTVLMNLNDKKSFTRDDSGKYILRKTQTA